VLLERSLYADAKVRRVPHRLRLGFGEDVGQRGRPMGGALEGQVVSEPGEPGQATSPCSVLRLRVLACTRPGMPGSLSRGEPGGVGSRKRRNRPDVLGEGRVLTVAEGVFWGKRALERRLAHSLCPPGVI
jgi:hypothetical protein